MHRFLELTIDEYFVFNLRRNSKVFICLLLCFACGLITGLLFGGKGLYVDGVFDYSIEFTIIIINGQASLITIFLRGLFVSFQLFLLVFLFSLSIYLFPLNFLFILYRGYILGAAIIVFTAQLGFQGFANVLILVVPQQIILLVSKCFCISYNFGCLRSTCRYNPSRSATIIIKPVSFFFIASLCHILVQIILIYVIIRPFNILI